jgi:hypothetical protein
MPLLGEFVVLRGWCVERAVEVVTGDVVVEDVAEVVAKATT